MIRLAVRAPAAHAEEVLGAMLEMAPSGIEQVDDGDTVEFAVYGAPGELPELEPGEAEVAGVRVQVSGTAVPDDWEERWKAFHQPVLVADRIYVRPPWEQPVGAEIDLEIDPGRAFGTGSHSTTRLCLALLVEVEPGDRPSTWAAGRACWPSRRRGWASGRSRRWTPTCWPSRPRSRTRPSTASSWTTWARSTCASTPPRGPTW